MLSEILATLAREGSDTPAYLELMRLTKLLLSDADQEELKAAIPELEKLEDETHRRAQED